jgi:hypothetical protein
MSKPPKTASRSHYVTSAMSGERVQVFVPAPLPPDARPLHFATLQGILAEANLAVQTLWRSTDYSVQTRRRSINRPWSTISSAHLPACPGKSYLLPQARCPRMGSQFSASVGSHWATDGCRNTRGIQGQTPGSLVPLCQVFNALNHDL